MEYTSPDHHVAVTRTHLADGRELLYFDDTAPYLTGEKLRDAVDTRDLPEASTHSVMRRDPLTGDWTVMAAHRMNRTFLPPANENPLAPTTPGAIPTEVPDDSYAVVVFENRFPSFSLHAGDGDSLPAALDGEEVFEQHPAIARCEVVCFSPNVDDRFADLTPQRARTVIEAWAHRTRELSAIPGIRQVFPFENRGKEIGVTLQHPHGQIYTYPYLPARTAAIVAEAKKYRTNTGRDLFADVLDAEMRSGRRVITATEHFVAFVPAAAKWPLEIMVLPRRDAKDFAELTAAEKDDLTTLYLDMLRRVDRFFPGVERTPYISGWNQAPVGDDREYFRFHLQLFSLMRSPGRMKYLAGSESAMGAWISDTTPEIIAARLREIADDHSVGEVPDIAGT